MGTYRKKPVEIQAVQWTGENLAQVLAFTGKHPDWGKWFASFEEYEKRVREDGGLFKILALEGTMVAAPGDWIIRGVKGEFYPCKPDIFEATYDDVLPDDWISRVQAERDQLSDRLAKLRYFFGTIAFNDLSITSQGLLQAQAEVMGAYLAILDVRLARAAGCE